MKECFVTRRDILTKFNPLYHALKIEKLNNEIEELYHSGTTITNYNYDAVELTTRSYSAEDVALAILDKKERLTSQIEKHKKYMSMHHAAIRKIDDKHEIVIHVFQTTGEYYQAYSKQYVLTIIDSYRQALNDLLIEDDESISDDEVRQLSGHSDDNVRDRVNPSIYPDKTDEGENKQAII